MQDADKFWDKISEKYASTPIADEGSYMQTLERTKSYLQSSDHILEVGCGTGLTALLLAKSVAQVTASDISAKMIEIGEEKSKEQNINNVKFVQADIDNSADIKGPYDAVLAHSLLHLLEDPKGAIEHFHTHLKQGGYFISKTFCSAGDSISFKIRLIKMIVPIMQFFGKAPKVNFLTGDALENMMIESGFKIIESGRYPKSGLTQYIVAQKI